MQAHAIECEAVWRTLSKGRCFVYVLPCREHDTLKIGYARDPWIRMRAFHPRFHTFFDLKRGALIETDHVKEARAIERQLKLKFAAAGDEVPLQVRERARGKFEWFRGIHSQLMDELLAISNQLGYPMHAPLSNWLREQWLPQLDHLVGWCRHEHEQIEAWHFNADPKLVEPRSRTFRNLIDAWESIGLPINERLPKNVQHWYWHGFD